MSIDFHKKTFGDRFKSLMKERKWTIQRAEEIFDVSKSTIQNWRKGADFPEGARLIRIADIFGIPIDWLLGRPGYPRAVEKEFKQRRREVREMYMDPDDPEMRGLKEEVIDKFPKGQPVEVDPQVADKMLKRVGFVIKFNQARRKKRPA